MAENGWKWVKFQKSHSNFDLSAQNYLLGDIFKPRVSFFKIDKSLKFWVIFTHDSTGKIRKWANISVGRSGTPKYFFRIWCIYAIESSTKKIGDVEGFFGCFMSTFVPKIDVFHCFLRNSIVFLAIFGMDFPEIESRLPHKILHIWN